MSNVACGAKWVSMKLGEFLFMFAVYGLVIHNLDAVDSC